jgi:pimeloyl-ACP methyl ester carboxylesterase
VALGAQIQAHLEFLDELLVAYDDDPTTRVLLVGHSIGCWLVQEILKARATGALRPRVRAYMLFPTISHIVRSPNGRKLSVRISSATPFPPSLVLDTTVTALLTRVSYFNGGVQLFFRPPWPRTVAYLTLIFRHVIPLFVLRLLHPSWPTSQLRVVHNLLRAPAAIYAALTMANDEMETVRELDTDFLRDFAQNLWFYYAEEDDWVGEQFAVVLRASRGIGSPTGSHVVLGRPGIPHAFCISASFLFASSLLFLLMFFPRRRS